MNVVSSNLRVLVLEDDLVDREAARRAISSAMPTATIATANSLKAAREILSNQTFDVIVTDYQLGDGNGLELQTEAAEAVTILVTGAGSEEVAVSALQLGVSDYLIKDTDSNYLHLLVARIEKAVHQKALEKSVAAQAEVYYALIDAAPVPMILFQADRVLHLNQAFTNLFGYSDAEIPTLGYWRELVIPDPDLREETSRNSHAILAAASESNVSAGPWPHVITSKAGKSVHVLAYMTKLAKPSGYALVTYVDVTSQVESARQTAELLDLLRHTETAARIGSWEVDISTGQEIWSPELRRIFDIDDELPIDSSGRLESYMEGDRARMLALRHQAIETGEGWDLELRRLTQTGRTIWVRQVCKVVREGGHSTKLFGYTQDITDHKMLSERVGRIEKLSAVGQLAGGVAHDINNNLAIISGSAELIQTKAVPESAAYKLTDRILSTVERCASLTRKLLSFSRQSPMSPKTFNLLDVLQQMRDTLERTLGGGIKVQVVPTQGQFNVTLDQGLLENCIINLSVNARDAMPKGGLLTFEVRSDFSSDPFGRPWIELTVSDTGTGMSQEVMDKIFEPFFTTKKPGHGTGLGLATTFGFVKQSEGEISVDSIVGVGTSFHIKFPAAQSDAVQGKPTDNVNTITSPKRGPVLIVEDNADLRDILQAQLAGLEYETLIASSFDQAVGLIKAGKRPEFILTDHDLGGGATGLDLMEWVCDNNLNIPGAIVTGRATFNRADVAARKWVVLDKPITRRDIMAAVLQSR